MKEKFLFFKKPFILALFFVLLLVLIVSLFFNHVFIFCFLTILLFLGIIACFRFKELIVLSFKEVRFEFNNISWASKSEVRQTTFVILIIVFLSSLFLWLVDSILTYIISKLL